MNLVFELLVLFQIKHFVADYIWQGPYKLGKFKADWSFFRPLLAHVFDHGVLTWLIALGIVPLWEAFALAIFDMTVHFFMDRIKAGPKYLGRFKALSANEMNEVKIELDGNNFIRTMIAKDKIKSNKYFWYSLGLDQAVHHLTHYVIIYFLVTH